MSSRLAFSVSTAGGDLKPNFIKSPDGGMSDTLGLEPSFLKGVQVQVLLGALCRSSSVGRAPDL